MRIAVGGDAGSAFFPEGAPGLHGVAVIVRGDATAEPSAHDRLVSGHDPKEMVAYGNYTVPSGAREFKAYN